MSIRYGALPRATFALTVVLLSAAPASADTFVVNDTADLPDATAPGDGVVDVDLATPGDQITLRAAIQEANALAGGDVISLPAGVFKLKLKGENEDLAATGDLDVRDELVIVGAGMGETIIDGKKAKDRVLHVLGVTLSLADVTIRKGVAKFDDGRGGAVYAAPGSFLDLTRVEITRNKCLVDGGGVAFVDADGVIRDSIFAKNKAKDDGGGVDVSGDCDLTLERVAFVANKAKEEGGAMEGSDAVITLINSTFFKNRARVGGAINLENGGDYQIVNCTLNRNIAKVAGGIHEVEAAGLFIGIANTIAAKNKKGSYVGDGVTSLGGNIDDDGSLGLTQSSDQSNVNPRLKKKLKDNGGPTPTVALKDDSPAIDAAVDVMAPSQDQRGFNRKDVPGVGSAIADVGAYEAGGVLDSET